MTESNNSATLSATEIQAIIDQWKDQTGPLLPILIAIKKAGGDFDHALIKTIAEALNLSQAEVHGVISFYEDLHRENKQPVLKICAAEACQSVNCRQLIEDVEAHYGQKINEKGECFTIESVYCLGNCALAPTVMVDESLYGRATLEKIKKWVKS